MQTFLSAKKKKNGGVLMEGSVKNFSVYLYRSYKVWGREARDRTWFSAHSLFIDLILEQWKCT